MKALGPTYFYLFVVFSNFWIFKKNYDVGFVGFIRKRLLFLREA